VRRALAAPSPHAFEESILFFAFSMFADTAWLIKLFGVYYDAYKYEISDGWQTATSAVLTELQRRPTTAYCVLTYLLLLTRNEFDFGHEIAATIPVASTAIRRQVADSLAAAVSGKDREVYPRCVYGIKSTTGRNMNRTGADYLTSDLRTNIQVTARSDILRCLGSVHTRMVNRHYSRFERIVSNYRNRWSKRRIAARSQLNKAERAEDADAIAKLTTNLTSIESHLAMVESLHSLYCHCPPLFDSPLVVKNVIHILTVAQSYD
jgi:hypothetical protein